MLISHSRPTEILPKETSHAFFRRDRKIESGCYISRQRIVLFGPCDIKPEIIFFLNKENAWMATTHTSYSHRSTTLYKIGTSNWNDIC